MKTYLLMTAAMTALTTPVVSQAAEAGEATTEVVVTGRKLLPARTTEANRTAIPNLLTPQAIQVVPVEVLQDQQVFTLSDATRNVSGVTTDFGFNGLTQPLLVLRGFPSTSMTAFGSMLGASNYYLDGTRVSGLPVNMTDVQAVEVLKGPNSVLFGRGEPGGVVNVVTKPLRATPGLEFVQTLGEYGLSSTSLNGGGAVNDDKTLLVGGSASYYTTDSVRDFVEEKLASVGLKVQWQASPNTTVSASADYLDHRYRNDYGIPAIGNTVANLPLHTQFNNAPELSHIESRVLRLEVAHRLSDNWSLKAKAISFDADMREVDITAYRMDMAMSGACDGDGNPLCRYYYYARPDGSNSMGQYALDLTGKITAGDITHNLLISADAYRAKKKGITLFSAIGGVDIYHPVFTNTPKLGDTVVLDALDYVDYNNWQGLSVQDQIDFGNGLNLVLAVRHDKAEAGYILPGVTTNTVEYTSPRAGLVWSLSPNQTLYAQAQSSLAANNGRDMLGKAVDPETAKQTEIGYKYQAPDGKLSATVALYELIKKNRADFTLYYVTGEILTTGEARSRGLEVDVIGEVTPALSLIASYAYTDTEVTQDANYQGKALANAPEHAASLWATYSVSEKWRVGAGLFYQGDRYGDIGNTFVMPAYTRVDAMVSRAFEVSGKPALIQLNVNNLFDERYYTGSHQFVQDWVQPGSPRTASVTLRLAY
ncbi:MAG: TonB-dependent siderophore receptor [Asticcacaulis sp.]|uniref:TonB-dependent siderophore receptor n=1 Tax=Asticcacaulis sp. TaxID=1872648 RepID=UPI0025C4C505|nr:TonB-dependent siderophore receptor [Asticcacaulis sp.]MCA1936910.1 TonB-dependent siderophore receptor [Asticcacaulis sp.]